MVTTIKRHFAEKAAASKLELLDKVPMFGVLTDAHKQLLAGALELVSLKVPPQSGWECIRCHRRGFGVM